MTSKHMESPHIYTHTAPKLGFWDVCNLPIHRKPPRIGFTSWFFPAWTRISPPAILVVVLHFPLDQTGFKRLWIQRYIDEQLWIFTRHCFFCCCSGNPKCTKTNSVSIQSPNIYEHVMFHIEHYLMGILNLRPQGGVQNCGRIIFTSFKAW